MELNYDGDQKLGANHFQKIKVFPKWVKYQWMTMPTLQILGMDYILVRFFG